MTPPQDSVSDVERLRAHIAEQIEHVEQRIADGQSMGAAIWRIALEDVVRENRVALSVPINKIGEDARTPADELADFASLMVDEVIAKTRLQLDAGEGLSVADQRLLLEQLIVERRRLSTSTDKGVR